MRFIAWLLLSVSVLVPSSLARSSSGNSVLVVTDSKLDVPEYSTFFDGLRSRGYDLTFRKTGDAGPVTSAFDEPNFSHLIIFAPSQKSYAADLSPQSLVELLKAGTNILFVLQSSTPSSPLRDLAREFGIAFPPPATPLVDHFSAADLAVNSTTLLLQPPVSPHSPSVGPGSQILYSGIAHSRSTNPLLVPFLNAPATSYSADPADGADAVVDAAGTGGEGLWAGAQMGLVTGFEILGGGGRALWVGSVDVFSNAYTSFINEKTFNGEYVQDLAAWTFQETSVLRINGVTHHRVQDTEPKEVYRIKDDLVFTMNVSSYDATVGSFVPTSSITDLQLEFTMLDPHIRIPLLPLPGREGVYEARFKAPDRHGVFKFIVDWRRKGFTPLHSSTTVSVVPFRHDEYPRFLSAAWPYYAGALSTSAGFVLFCALWLLGGDDTGDRRKDGKKLQ